MRVHVREWPGASGPLIHIPDPLAASDLIEAVAALLAPRWRVLSVTPRPATPYQVAASDAYGVLSQFGFAGPTVVGEGLGCVSALLLAAWYPERVGRLVLVHPRSLADGDSLEARAIRECPPHCEALRATVRCPITEARSAEEVAATLP